VTLALITNDDGIASPGLAVLAGAARDAGLDVVVAAPLHDSSGGSCSLIAVQEGGRIAVERRDAEPLGAQAAFAVAAMPALISLMGLQGAFGGVPDLVLSGVNEGLNTGRAVIHSGTVGAVITACMHGRPGLAVSRELAEEPHWDVVRAVARDVVAWFAASPQPRALTLNIPHRGAGELAGLRPARLAAFGAVQAKVVDTGEGSVTLTYEEVADVPEEGTDAALVAEGWATLTALDPLAEVPLVDLDGVLDPTAGATGATAR
jgi:5'-nucleotidase